MLLIFKWLHLFSFEPTKFGQTKVSGQRVYVVGKIFDTTMGPIIGIISIVHITETFLSVQHSGSYIRWEPMSAIENEAVVLNSKIMSQLVSNRL